MTKTISLSDEAYEDLVAIKRPGESFSDLARRLALLDRKRALFDRSTPSPFAEGEARALLASVYEARDRTLRRRTEGT
jgi:predicted CopG family antitoxin